MSEEEADKHLPKIVILDDDNSIAQEFEGLRIMFEGLDMGKMSEMIGTDASRKHKRCRNRLKNVEFTAKAGGGLIEITAKWCR